MPAKRGERPVRSQRAGRGRSNASSGKEEIERDEPAAEESADQGEGGELTVAKAAREGRRLIAEVTNREPEGVTSVEPSEDGWVIEVEVLEDRHIPSSADILALYEVEVDADGELLSYRRTQRYPRGRPSSSSGKEA